MTFALLDVSGRYQGIISVPLEYLVTKHMTLSDHVMHVSIGFCCHEMAKGFAPPSDIVYRHVWSLKQSHVSQH